MKQKRTLRISLVLITSGVTLFTAAGCHRQHDDNERKIGGGTYYQSSGQGWTSDRSGNYGYSHYYPSYHSYGYSHGGFGDEGGRFGGRAGA